MPFAQHRLDVRRDVRIVQRVVDVVAVARAAVGQRDVEIELQRLGYALLPLVDADQRRDLEFAYENDVHAVDLLRNLVRVMNLMVADTGH